MPTASKFFAALAFAAVGFFTAEIYRTYLPVMPLGYFSLAAALLGVISGWTVLGPEAGRGMWQSANAGLKTAVVLMLLALFVFSTYEMLVQALRLRYDDAFEAILGMIDLASQYFIRLFHWDVILALFGGGMLAGLLAEWAAKRWP